MRYGMVIDLSRCMGCYGCQMACKAEHNTPPAVFWGRVLQKEEGQYPSVRMTFLPVLCYHCQEPSCRDVCPTGATTKREDGIVAIDYDLCVGCRACMIACPYQNRYFWGKSKNTMYFPEGPSPYELTAPRKFQRGAVQKCDFCRERLERGLEPSCVVTCPTTARTFGDLDDPNSEVSRLIGGSRGFQILSEMDTDPSVYYID